LIKSPSCYNCRLLFQKYPELQDLDFDVYTFDSNSSEGVRKFLEENCIFTVPATILRTSYGLVYIHTSAEVTALAERIKEAIDVLEKEKEERYRRQL